GDHNWEAPEGGLKHAIDLVRLIREEHGNFFGVAVAGHPEGHPEARAAGQEGSQGLAEELQRLKQKVDAGADFIVTQFFYDTDAFLDYERQCREIGIECPIIPGIMPIQVRKH
ncbi:unnamed protein product, partial [Discosporangium mesarthrocarpum]